MGKKLDAIFGRTFKASKFKALANLAISRLAVFKNQRQVRCNQAHSDVLQLLQQGHHERALLRVDQVIKEQNMLDTYVMMEGYCNLVVERVHLMEQDRICPDELKEAVSSLLYASSRCGDFPELQEIRTVFTSRFGKEFAARAIELRNHCGVDPKMIQKLSTRQPSLDSRMKLLKEIASENNIVLQLEVTSIKTEEKLDSSKKHNQHLPETSNNSGSPKPVDNLLISPEGIKSDGFTDSVKGRKKYTDVADAAQAAFESAAYAAAAARAAVELSRSYSHDPDNQNSPNNRGITVSVEDETVKPESEPCDHESRSENKATELNDNNAVEQKNSVPTSSTNSDIEESDLRVTSMTLDPEELLRRLEKDIVFYDSDNESHGSGSEIRSSNTTEEVLEDEKKVPSVIQAGRKVDSVNGNYTAHTTEGPGIQSSQHLNRGKEPFSFRTRGVRGY
ncbi:uncharacterized protein LOC8269696 [Ricinus communis]|uniref:uncharacterized protein LOC8269696 n=1 Tax=Ricinus communis TaxID=3988 RepID=UPI00201B026C|nr:uncharacterized protein LOC8269696 [Ricinus communis]